MNIVAVSRKFVALLVVAVSGFGVLVATSAGPAAAAAATGGCAGKAFVTNSDDTVSVITLATGRSVGTDPVGGRVQAGLGVTPDGKHVYVTNPNDGTQPGTVSVIDTATGVVSATIAVGKGPVGLGVRPDGKEAY